MGTGGNSGGTKSVPSAKMAAVPLSHSPHPRWRRFPFPTALTQDGGGSPFSLPSLNMAAVPHSPTRALTQHGGALSCVTARRAGRGALREAPGPRGPDPGPGSPRPLPVPPSRPRHGLLHGQLEPAGRGDLLPVRGSGGCTGLRVLGGPGCARGARGDARAGMGMAGLERGSRRWLGWGSGAASGFWGSHGAGGIGGVEGVPGWTRVLGLAGDGGPGMVEGSQGG